MSFFATIHPHILMKPEQNRQERCSMYAQALRERLQSGILAELHPLRQWIVWRAEQDQQGKQKKVPYNPRFNLAHVSVNRPSTWGILDQALTALESGNYSGIGFMITPPLVFIDLDHCFDKETKTITDPQAAEIVDAHQFVKGGQAMLSSVLWGVVALLVLFWLFGWLVGHVGGLIHLLLVVAVLVLLYNLFVAGRSRL